MVDVEPIHLFVYGTLKRGGKSPYARLLQMRSKMYWTSLYTGAAL